MLWRLGLFQTFYWWQYQSDNSHVALYQFGYNLGLFLTLLSIECSESTQFSFCSQFYVQVDLEGSASENSTCGQHFDSHSLAKAEHLLSLASLILQGIVWNHHVHDSSQVHVVKGKLKYKTAHSILVFFHMMQSSEEVCLVCRTVVGDNSAIKGAAALPRDLAHVNLPHSNPFLVKSAMISKSSPKKWWRQSW